MLGACATRVILPTNARPEHTVERDGWPGAPGRRPPIRREIPRGPTPWLPVGMAVVHTSHRCCWPITDGSRRSCAVTRSWRGRVARCSRGIWCRSRHRKMSRAGRAAMDCVSDIVAPIHCLCGTQRVVRGSRLADSPTPCERRTRWCPPQSDRGLHDRFRVRRLRAYRSRVYCQRDRRRDFVAAALSGQAIGDGADVVHGRGGIAQ